MIWGVNPLFSETPIYYSPSKKNRITIYPRGKLTYPTKREKENHHRLQNCLFLGDMLVPRRVYLVDLPKSLALKSPVSNPRGARFCPAALHPRGRSTTGTPKNGGLVGCCVFSNWVMHLGSFRRSFSGVYWLRWGLATYSWLKFSFCVGKYKTHPKRCNQRCHTTLPRTRGFCVILKKWRKIWRISKSLLCSRQKQILALQQPTDFARKQGVVFVSENMRPFPKRYLSNLLDIPVRPNGLIRMRTDLKKWAKISPFGTRKVCETNITRKSLRKKTSLVGGWTNPSEKYGSKWVHLPQVSGWK